jgi:transposase InsO family protein
MIIKSFDKHVPIRKRLSWSTLNPSSYYYKPRNGKPGRLPSTVTLKTDGSIATNHQVVEAIQSVLGIEFLCYGYKPVAEELFDRGFLINHKKVYRLMSENKLLCGTAITVHGSKRKFVQFRKIKALYPLEYLCMDIKYIPIKGKFAYLLSLIDIYSRKIVGSVFKKSIKQHDVLWLLKNVLPQGANIQITIRNDNGSQFIAKSVRSYLEEINVNHEFAHIATPEDNAYIEAFHSIMERELTSKYEFESLYHAEMKITQYIFTYNNIRKHGSLGHRTPQSVWNEYIYSLLSDKQQSAAKPENLSRFFEEKTVQSLNIQTTPTFSSKMHFNLDKFGGGAKFDYLMANENIRNFIMFKQSNCF